MHDPGVSLMRFASLGIHSYKIGCSVCNRGRREQYGSHLISYTGLGKKVGLRFGAFCSCCCFPPLPQLAKKQSRNLGPASNPALYMI